MRLDSYLSHGKLNLLRSVALLCAGVVAGCGGGGPALSYVKGTVTRGGTPVPGITVTFTQVDKNFSAAGRTNDQGVFVLISQNGKSGALPGKNKVTLTVPAIAGGTVVNMSDPSSAEQVMKARQADLQGGKRGAPASTKASDKIPPEYSNPSKTPLEYEVKTGSNDFDIPIP